MKKIIKVLKQNIFGFIIGLVIAGSIGVYAATVLASKDVTYSNTTSGLSATTVQGAIDELYEKSKSSGTKCPDGYKCLKLNTNIVEAYTYNSSTCVTGEESTCAETICYGIETVGSCPAGTIVKYKVNNTTTKYFHVLHDDGETMTMQQRENTVYNTKWYDYDDNTKGPLTILAALENVTKEWTNVNNQTYAMGTTTFLTNQYTECDINLSCTTNKYTLGSRTAKARMITFQEALASGCTRSGRSCPNWMINYLYESTSYGGTVNDTTGGYNYGYWTMSAYPSSSVWYISYGGYFHSTSVYNSGIGARAVVVISK